MKSAARTFAILVPAAILLFLGWRLTITPSAAPAPAPLAKLHSKSLIDGKVCTKTCHYAGVALATTTSISGFVSSTHIVPGIIEIYQPFTAPFPEPWALSVVERHILPLIQINPRQTPLAKIAAGDYDSRIASYAKAVKKFHHPVALSFAHEMNGRWYNWGCSHVSPQVYVAAWRHLVTTMRSDGATNVIWVWTANVAARGDCPLVDRYPGNSYVDWVGLDGYLRRPGTTFSRIFGGSLVQIRNFSDKPILIAEAGANSGPQWAKRLTSLFQGAANARRVIGLVYFDSQTRKYGNYKPQDNPSALAAFKRGVKMILHLPSTKSKAKGTSPSATPSVTPSAAPSPKS